MRISYDKTVDVLYIGIKDRPAIATDPPGAGTHSDKKDDKNRSTTYPD